MAKKVKKEIRPEDLKLPKEMTLEELWENYGSFLYYLAHKVCRFRHTDGPESLLGVGFLAMQRSAQSWRPGKGATFLHYSARVILGKMREAVYREQGLSRPRPKHRSTEDPHAGRASINHTSLSIKTSGEDSPALLARLEGEIVEQFNRDNQGANPSFTSSPEELVDFRKYFQRLEKFIQDTRYSGRTSGPRVGSYMEQVWIQGKENQQVSKEYQVNVGTISSALQRHRRKLRQVLHGDQVA